MEQKVNHFIAFFYNEKNTLMGMFMFSLMEQKVNQFTIQVFMFLFYCVFLDVCYFGFYAELS